MKKTLALGAATLLTAASLAACGSSGNYCETYEDAKDELGDFDMSESADYDKLQDYISQLHDAAPEDDLKQAWETTDEMFAKIKDNLEDIGLSFKDLDKLQDIEDASDLPEDVSMQDMQKFVGSMQKITNDDDVSEAQKTIDDYADENCEADS